MKTTKYLTGYSQSRYEPELSNLVNKRVFDMQEMRTKIREASSKLDKQCDAYLMLSKQSIHIQEAIDWWRQLLDK